MTNVIHRFLGKVRDSLAARVHHWLLYSQREQELTRSALTCTIKGITDQKIAETQVIVNLTTHGRRIHDVHLAIESIMQGSILPNRMILWLSVNYDKQCLPQVLLNQCERGLEIRYVQDIGPYTKLIPALSQYPEAIHVTIDDDILYPYDTLELLLSTHRLHPQSICANRILDMSYDANHKLKAMSSWPELVEKTRVSPLNFFEGVGGVLYPSGSLSADVLQQSVFYELAPLADDVWFNAMARLNRTDIRCSNTHYHPFPLLINERVQDMALWRINNHGGYSPNDQQLNAVFKKYNIDL